MELNNYQTQQPLTNDEFEEEQRRQKYEDAPEYVENLPGWMTWHETRRDKKFYKLPYGTYCQMPGCGDIAYAKCERKLPWFFAGCGKTICKDHILVRYSSNYCKTQGPT